MISSAKNITIIAREGYRHIFVAFLPFALSVYGDFFTFLQFLFFLLFIYTLFFFRNPERVVADDSVGSVLAPVDGVIDAIERLEDGSGVLVRIGTGIFDTHVVRAPFKTAIKRIGYRHGMSIIYNWEKAGKLNSRCEIDFGSVKMSVLTSFLPYAMRCYAREGEEVHHGERIGYFYGGTTELLLPSNINLHVNIGDHVKSAENLIGIVKE